MSSFPSLVELNGALFFMTVLAILFVTLVLKWYLGVLIPSRTSNTKKLPPSPPRLPIIGNILSVGLLPHRSLHALAQRLGPFMLLHMGNVPLLVVSSADGAQEITKTHDLIFANRPKTRMFQKLVYKQRDVATAPYGDSWRQLKSISVVHLLSNKMVYSFRAVREEEIALMIDKIKKASSSSLPVNLSEIFVTLANNVVCRVALGQKYDGGEEGRRFKKLLNEFTDSVGSLDIGDYIPWLSWVSRVNGLDAKADKVAIEFDEFLEGVVEEHINRQENESFQGEEHKDFVDVLLCLQRENAVGSPLERINIKALILDMFAAGTDTTSTILEWEMAELLRNPKVMKKVQKEVREVAGEKPYVTEDDLDNTHYLRAVIKESLRCHPPLPFLLPRESTRDVKIQGYDIAAGTQVLVNVWAIGRDPAFWENPEDFVPERFLNSSIEYRGQNFELIPFGSGRRGCPGIMFAIKINELFLANLVHKFEWTLPGGAKDLDMAENPGLTAHRKFPLVAIPSSCS